MPKVCIHCQSIPCICENPKKAPKEMIRVVLSDQRERDFFSTVETSFYDSEGKPISISDFTKNLFNDIPLFFKDENELRKLWSYPSTRKKLLDKLKKKGYNQEHWETLKNLIKGGKESDLYDLLAYIAYCKDLVPREARANKVEVQFGDYTSEQQEFLKVVLNLYVREGEKELAEENLGRLLYLEYGGPFEAEKIFGSLSAIRSLFSDFQQYLYQ